MSRRKLLAISTVVFLLILVRSAHLADAGPPIAALPTTTPPLLANGSGKVPSVPYDERIVVDGVTEVRSPLQATGKFPKALPGERITVEGVTEVRLLPPASIAWIEPATAIMSEDFEGTWPAPGWDVADDSSSDGGEYFWGKRDCHPHAGNFAGWSVGAGANGSLLVCSSNYPDNTRSWAVYGPFDLSSAIGASMTFHLWGITEAQSQCQYDFLFVGSSTNGTNFSGSRYCGDWTAGDAGNGYHQRTFDLSSRLGQSQVWVGLALVADSSKTYSGMTIDDVTLDVTSASPDTPTPTATSTMSGTSTPTLTSTTKPEPSPTPTSTSTALTLFFPLVLKHYPPVPYTPVLNAVSNPDGDGNYTVSWNTAYLANTYTLQEDDNPSFSSPATRYAGAGMSWNATGKQDGTYYYRVKATNSWGDSGWSNVQSASVQSQMPTTLSPTADTTVIQAAPTANFGSTVDMWVGYDHCSGGKVSRGLIEFDVSSIPSGASISQARLSLYLMGSCDSSNRAHTVTAYRAQSSWWSSSVTWNTQPGYGPAYGSASVSSRTWGRYSIDVTNLVRGWVNGSLPNYGIVLRGPEGSGNDSALLQFFTLNESGQTYDPYLSITYAGAATSEEEVSAVEEALNTNKCGPVVKDVLHIPSSTSAPSSFERVAEEVCSPE